jgi:hypothetical protein
LLLPFARLKNLPITADDDVEMVKEVVVKFAASHNLSSSMVAYRLYREEMIDHDTWQNLSRFYQLSWLQKRLDERTAGKEKRSSGPSYFIIRKHRIGSTLIDFVGQMMAAGTVTTTKAGKILDVNPSKVQRLVDLARTI